MVTVATIEHCALTAWPAVRQQVVDGWVARFANGFTRRANSVQPLGSGILPTEERIARCEAAYRGQGLRCVFKITPLAQPAGLDDVLAARGYEREGETSVQVVEPLPSAGGGGAAELAEPALDDWLADFVPLNGIAAADVAALRAILARIPVATRFGVLRDGDQTVACGLAVLDGEAVGLFDLVTDPATRRQGHGEHLVRGLLAWAAGRGARRSYLQVVVDNTPAVRLYEKLGFREVYRYWYRVKDGA